MVIDYENFYIVNNRSVMDFHFFYVYYDGEMYYDGIGLMKLQRRILKAMGLDHCRHNISIMY